MAAAGPCGNGRPDRGVDGASGRERTPALLTRSHLRWILRFAGGRVDLLPSLIVWLSSVRVGVGGFSGAGRIVWPWQTWVVAHVE